MLNVILKSIPNTSNNDAIYEFRLLLSMCLNVNTRNELESNINILDESDFIYIEWGFGGSHFWAMNTTTQKHIIFIEL